MTQGILNDPFYSPRTQSEPCVHGRSNLPLVSNPVSFLRGPARTIFGQAIENWTFAMFFPSAAVHSCQASVHFSKSGYDEWKPWSRST